MSVNSRYNYFNTNFFAWINFSASHIVNIPINLKFCYDNKYQIRIAWISRINNKSFVYNHKVLGGGFFMGYYKTMMAFI